MTSNISQQGLWLKMNVSLKRVRKDVKIPFVPKVIVRKAV